MTNFWTAYTGCLIGLVLIFSGIMLSFCGGIALDAMSDALERGHRIEIRGFGSFSINHRPPRLGRNPRTGERVHIPERRVPHFKPGKALREAIGAQPVTPSARAPEG